MLDVERLEPAGSGYEQGVEAGDGEQPAIGLLLTRTARSIERAFDGALAGNGGSASTWLILAALNRCGRRSQRELADAVGLRGATLTHHLSAMEADGLLTRRRDHADRRNHSVELTEEGRARFTKLRPIALDFDAALRSDIESDALTGFARVLAAMRSNVTENPRPPRRRRAPVREL